MYFWLDANALIRICSGCHRAKRFHSIFYCNENLGTTLLIFFCSLLLDQTFYFNLQPKQTYVCMHKYALTLRGRRIAFSILELIHIDTIPGYINISFSFYFFVRASARRGTKGVDRFQPFYSSHGNDGALTVEVSECS